MRKTIKDYLVIRKEPKRDIPLEIEGLEIEVSNHTFYEYDHYNPIEEIRVTDCFVSYHPADKKNYSSNRFDITLNWVEKQGDTWENKNIIWTLNVSEKELRNNGSSALHIKGMVLSSIQLAIGNFFRNRIPANVQNPVLKRNDFLNELNTELTSNSTIQELQRKNDEKDLQISDMQNELIDLKDRGDTLYIDQNKVGTLEKFIKNLNKRIDVLQEASTNQFEEVMKPVIEQTEVIYENGTYFTCCIKSANDQTEGGRNACHTCGRGLTNKLREKMGMERLDRLPV